MRILTLVENFVQTRSVSDLPADETLGCLFQNEHGICDWFDGANVCVRADQAVLTLRKFSILRFDRLAALGGSGNIGLVLVWG